MAIRPKSIFRFPWTIAVLVACLIGLVPWATFAQASEPTLASWRMSVWPEYDQPSVLVIYSGTLAEGTQFPVTLSVPVPAGVKVNAVAERDQTGNLVTVPSTNENGRLVFDVNQSGFVVEFYDDILSAPPNRSFDLTLVAPYAADQADLSVRQPSRATDFKLTPALAAAGTDNLGNPQFSQSLGPLTAGQQIPLSVSYVKNDADPSVDMSAAPSPDTGQESSDPASAATSPAWLPWLVGAALGALAVAAVALVVTQLRQNSGRSRQARRLAERQRGAPRAGSGASMPAPAADKSGDDRFCPNCGHKYQPDDQFCRQCGAPRR